MGGKDFNRFVCKLIGEFIEELTRVSLFISEKGLKDEYEKWKESRDER